MLDRLPFPARRKYESLVALVEDQRALTRNSQERIATIEQSVARVDYDIRRLSPRDLETDPDTIAELKLRRDQLIAELDPLQRQLNTRNALRGNTEQVLAQIRDVFLPRLCGQGTPNLRCPNITYRPIRPRKGQTRGETTEEAILRLRRDISKIQADLVTLHAAPLTSTEIRDAVFDEVDRFAREGCPTLAIDNGKVQISWPDIIPFANPGQPLTSPSGSATRMLCWLFRDQIYQHLTQGLVGHTGISADERREKEKKLRERLLTLERWEEHLVCLALDQGLEVHRRPTADPMAILNIAFVTPQQQIQTQIVEAAE
jgi:hypothetical protein